MFDWENAIALPVLVLQLWASSWSPVHPPHQEASDGREPDLPPSAHKPLLSQGETWCQLCGPLHLRGGFSERGCSAGPMGGGRRGSL